MKIRLCEGRRAGELVEMQYQHAIALIDAGRAVPFADEMRAAAAPAPQPVQASKDAGRRKRN